MKKFNAFVVLLSTIFCILYILLSSRHTQAAQEIVVVDTVVVHETIYYKKPVPVDSVVIKYVTKTLEVAPKVDADTTHTDSVEVNVPITQKIYSSQDYRIWVSGYMANLDSVDIYKTNQVLTVNSTKTKQPKFSVGLQAGMGVSPDKIYPYIGIGISYNLWSW